MLKSRGTAFLTYEILITFDREVALVWRRKFTGASVLFFLNRYLPILVNVLNLASSARMTDAVRYFRCRKKRDQSTHYLRNRGKACRTFQLFRN